MSTPVDAECRRLRFATVTSETSDGRQRSAGISSAQATSSLARTFRRYALSDEEADRLIRDLLDQPDGRAPPSRACLLPLRRSGGRGVERLWESSRKGHQPGHPQSRRRALQRPEATRAPGHRGSPSDEAPQAGKPQAGPQEAGTRQRACYAQRLIRPSHKSCWTAVRFSRAP